LLENKILVSIVIHNQSLMVEPLIDELLHLTTSLNLKIILRVNTREDIANLYRFFSNPSLIVVYNFELAGYGSNHNRNFEIEPCDYFLVLNPDIRLIDTNFNDLLRHFKSSEVGVVAPKVVTNDLVLEDSVRVFPSVYALFKRYLFSQGIEADRYRLMRSKIDWCAGMFMVFSSNCYRLVNGFDTKYFMYLEDADICLRLRYLNGKRVMYDDSFSCVHNAQRASRSFFKKAFLWHASSLLKFQFTYIRLKFFKGLK